MSTETQKHVDRGDTKGKYPSDTPSGPYHWGGLFERTDLIQTVSGAHVQQNLQRSGYDRLHS